MIKLRYLLFIYSCLLVSIFPENGKADSGHYLAPPPPNFWEFPEVVEPSVRSGFWFHGQVSELDYVGGIGIRIPWSDMNPREGVYDFSILEDYLALAEEKDISVVLRLTCSVVKRKSSFPEGDAQAPFVPTWVINKHNPPQFNTFEDTKGNYITVAAPWDENLQLEYRRFIAEFGSRGFLANPRLAGVYLHGISTSFGEECWMRSEFVANAEQAGMSEEKFLRAFSDRIDWWSSAAGEHRNKVVWVNCGRIGDSGYDYRALNKYALDAGLGWREGGIEEYHVHRPPDLGLTLQKDGYVSVDWSASIRDGRYFGEEIENKLQDLYPGITDQEQIYFAQSSLMKATLLGMNHLWSSRGVIDGVPEMFKWWTLIAGKNADKAPDAICWLREDYYGDSSNTTRWKNMEHFLFQRDLPNAVTKPIGRVDRPEFYSDPPGVDYDYTARSTDKNNGSNAMVFLFDDTFRKSLKGNFALKVYYYDNSTNIWQLEIPTASGIITAGTVKGVKDDQWKTANFTVRNLPEKRPAATDYDFRFRVVSGEDLAVRFVRALKIGPGPTPNPPGDKHKFPIFFMLNIERNK